MATPEISVVELDALVKQMFDLRAEIEAIEEGVKVKNKELRELQDKTMAVLKQLGRENYKSDAGTISVREIWRVSLPKDEEAKKAMFAHLKSMGILWQYATVNSNSLNSLYNEEWERAKEAGAGMEFAFPGVEAPKLFESISMRKK